LRNFFVFAFVLALFYTSAMEPEANVGELSSLDVITQAHLRGELDAETSLVYRVWAVLDPQRLPPRFQSQPRRFLKSLTPLLLEVRTHWDSLSPRAKAMLAPYLLRPTEPGQEPFPYGHSYLVPAVYYDSPGGHFRIWYVTSTRDSPVPVYTHGDTIPDWIHLCAQVFDHVWEVEVDSLGYRQPPADGPWYGDEDYGGDSRYDVYVEDLDNHWVYGYTQSEYVVPEGHPLATTSYLVVDNDYSSSIYPTPGNAGLMVTAAHEFFHAVQFAYDTREERFFMEISSTWMEDVVYDAVNDYYYYLASGSSALFNCPELSLVTFDGIHEYSSCVWAHYLAKRFGRRIMREIWEGCVQKTALDAMGEVLDSRGMTLASAHNEFAIWNYFTGSRADTNLFYPEGNRYPQVAVYTDNVHSNYPVVVDSVSYPPEPLGASYARFVTQDTPGGLRIELEGQPQVSWKAALLGIGPPHEIVGISLNVLGRGSGQMLNWSQYGEVTLVITPFALSGSGLQYAYRGVPDSSLTEPSQTVTWLGQNYPNPVVGDRTVIPFYVAAGGQVSFRIFTIDGQVVHKYEGYLEPGHHDGPDWKMGGWDCTNARGERVSAGIYLYQLKAGDFVKTRKMVVVR